MSVLRIQLELRIVKTLTPEVNLLIPDCPCRVREVHSHYPLLELWRSCLKKITIEQFWHVSFLVGMSKKDTITF